jgi:hypothetical protein
MDQPLSHRIREGAYEIWSANGCPDGQRQLAKLDKKFSALYFLRRQSAMQRYQCKICADSVGS